MEDGEGTQYHGSDQSQNLTVSPGGETGQDRARTGWIPPTTSPTSGASTPTHH